MSDQQGEPEPPSLYIQHQYMCSECAQLFNTLEEVLLHQQSHTGPDGEGAEDGGPDGARGAASDPQLSLAGLGGLPESQYQCLECGAVLSTPEELLLHQELHLREGGVETEQGLCQVVESGSVGTPVHTALPLAGQIQYQCLECQALFDSPEVWLAHRQMHSKTAGQMDARTEPPETELLLQTDGSLGPFVSVQNLVLSEQRAGEILAQVLAAQQQQQQQDAASSLPTGRGATLPGVTSLSGGAAGTATLRLQLCTAQALADGTPLPPAPRRGRLAPLLPSCPPRELHGNGLLAHVAPHGGGGRTAAHPPFPEHCYQRAQATGGVPPGGQKAQGGVKGREGDSAGAGQDEDGAGEVVIFHPYECSECALLFQTPEDFLQHQGEHFLGQEKESGEGVMEAAGGGGGGGEEEEEEEEEGEEGERGRVKGPAFLDRPGPVSVSHRRHQCAPGLPLPRSRSPAAAGPAPVPLQCEECRRTFTSANRLSAHRRVHEHGTHECPECRKLFKKASSLETHLRAHSGEARYLCLDCGLGFATEMTLIMHRKSHTAEPLHRCQYCAKTFTNMTKFLYHRRTHSARPGIPVSMVALSPRKPLALLGAQPVSQPECEAVQPVPALQTGSDLPDGALCLSGGGTAAAPAGDSRGADGGESEAGGEAEPGNGRGGEDGSRASLPEEHQARDRAAPAVPDAGNAAADSVANGVRAEPPARDRPFPCPSCPKSFPTQIRLVRHRRTVHVLERRFKCGVCGKPFKKQVHVRNHLRTHTGERPFQCSDCGKTFSSLANLSRHGLTHSGLRPYRCDVCLKAFSQSSNLRQHRLLHASPAPFPCPDCPAAFVRPAKLAAHRYAQHAGAPPPYPCARCPSGFLRKRQLDRHQQEAHGAAGDPGASLPAAEPSRPGPDPAPSAAGLRPGLDCSVCGKRLNSAANLRLHELGCPAPPAPRRGHQCAVCGKLFVSSSGLALHQRVHTGERPFPCPHCGKRFRQNTHLREHLRTHSGERPFRCELCHKGFVQSMHLAEHRRTHTGERPHACPLCGKAFKTFSNLRSHRKTHARRAAAGGGGGGAPGAEGASAIVVSGPAAADSGVVELSAAAPALRQQRETQAAAPPQVIQLQQTQGTPTIMCTEFGDTIAIIETGDSGLPIAEAIEIYQTAIENGLGLDNITLL